MITVIILTYNEERHLERCINSVLPIADKVLVIDSLSTDETVKIAQSLGAEVYQNKWPGSQALQFNWALDHVAIDSEWLLRMDADEYFLPELADEIKGGLMGVSENINGIYLKRRVYFMDHWIRFGGYYPIYILRIWRTGHGRFERRWMDEHLLLKPGSTLKFKNDFVDANLNDLTWWTEKHNNYATREAAELLNYKHKFLKEASIGARLVTHQDHYTRFFKEGLYLRLPIFLRALLYFLYRYVVRFGFLDGTKGLIWHFLQGFWYRFLVDAKMYQIEERARKSGKPVREELEKVLGFTIDAKEDHHIPRN
ncbi:MAG: glycosyltransferase family 2 protein [Imperialibacter sp.]|uniref:glycosyltransferase family 2 protein n=1 Tax=Imperialibacter sp. TaxID=2038411 RepID=UPI0032EAB300